MNDIPLDSKAANVFYFALKLAIHIDVKRFMVTLKMRTMPPVVYRRAGASGALLALSCILGCVPVTAQNDTLTYPSNPPQPVNSSTPSNPKNSSVQPQPTAPSSAVPNSTPPNYSAPNDGLPSGAPVSTELNYGQTGGVSTPGELTSSPLPPSERKQEVQIIEGQASDFRNRYLMGETIELVLPKPQQMIPLGIGGRLPPIRLEASYTQSVNLRDVLRYAMENNLDIRIQQEQVNSERWDLASQMGRFLPDTIMNYQSQFIQGSQFLGGTIPITFQTPNVNTQAGFRFFGFRGGSVMFGTLQQLHVFKASKQQLRGSVNDTLLSVTRSYYNMIRNQALLQIQTRAVDVSKAQVTLNQQLQRAGTGTKFQVLQAETQLARDEQNLLLQQVDLRRTAIQLATTLNLNSSVNLLSQEPEVKKVRLLDNNIDINRIIALAILNRPELKQFEELRLAARRAVQVAAAPLYPRFSFFGTITGSGQTLSQKYAFVPGSFRDVPVTGTPPTGSVIDITQGNGNNPTGNINQFVNPALNSTLTASGQVFTPPSFQSRQIRPSYAIGFLFDWNQEGLGLPTAMTVGSQKALARQALLRSNQTLINTLQQVRDSYLTSQTAERQIEVATKGVLSAAEELRLARVRLANGVGTNIDVINAQRDFTQSLVTKADAIIQFNISQAQLLRDMGLISVDNLSSGRLVTQ
ncbi:MAG: TolC family protein [Leptolyngbya sp.]|nr:TolC family protein [Candidatus Melainabacteria bacterium]